LKTESTTGLILRTRPLTETSLIVLWLTPDFGRLATVAKGARRPHSPFAGKLDLFYRADFSFSRSRRSELHTLREVSLRETHPALRQELGYLQQASYCSELVEQTTETETPLPAVFELMCGLLNHLTKHPSSLRSSRGNEALSEKSEIRNPKSEKEQSLLTSAATFQKDFQPQTLFAFELKLLNELGLKPNLDQSRLTPGAKQIVNALTAGDWAALSRLKLSEAQVAELSRFLHGFLIFHLGRIPKGRATLAA
jgi:DNA repair protein RecO (recombination protein O)